MTYVPKVLTGIDMIDTSWGGMYQGGSYMCYGHASSGRGLLGMLFLQTGVLLEETCLFLSPGRPHDWMIQASTVNFDLKAARDSGQVRLVWIPSSHGDAMPRGQDASRIIGELTTIIHKEAPKRLVINDFSPFLRFRSFEQFKVAFVQFMQQLGKLGDTTLILMMPDAVNKPSQQIIDFMKNHMTGSVHIALEKEEGAENKRRVTLLPGIGHVNHELFAHWKIPGEARGTMPEVQVHTEPNTNFSRRSMTPNLLKAGSLAHIEIEDVIPLHGKIALPTVGIESIQKVTLENEVFFSKLKRLFKQRELSYFDPFLLVALRMEHKNIDIDPDIVFDNVLSVMTHMIEDEDHMLCDLDRERIIVVLPNKGAESIQEVFEELQAGLKEQAPDQAEILPNAVSAVAVADGHPFGSPEDFLAYALEGE